MVFFSVIIPTFNREKLIRATLDSVFHQSFDDYEVIVVDDGSTDDTINALEEYGDKIKILKQENQGSGEARNQGIKIAQGKYIVFLDSDDLWFPWTLTTFYQAITEQGFPEFVAGKCMTFSHEDEVTTIQPLPLSVRGFNDYYSSNKENIWIPNGGVAINSDILRKVGGFTKQWINAEDSDLWLKLGTAKGFAFIESPLLLAYRQHINTAVSDKTKTYTGISYLIQQETTDQYPGEKTRQKERLEILTRHIRPVSLECLRTGKIKKGWELYKQTFSWHIQLRRSRYLIGFLWLIITAIISYCIKNKLGTF